MNWLSLNFYDKFCVAGIMSCSSLLFSSERFITKWARKGPYFTPLKKQQHQNGMERHTSDKAIYDIVMFRVNMWQFIGQWTMLTYYLECNIEKGIKVQTVSSDEVGYTKSCTNSDPNKIKTWPKPKDWFQNLTQNLIFGKKISIIAKAENSMVTQFMAIDL